MTRIKSYALLGDNLLFEEITSGAVQFLPRTKSRTRLTTDHRLM